MIYGGKNDTMYEAACLSDLYMLRLSNFNWIKINYFNNAKELPKADHFAFAVGTLNFISFYQFYIKILKFSHLVGFLIKGLIH